MIDRTTNRATTRPRFITALREIARALSAAWDLDTTLDLIARKTTEVMLVDSCSIYLLDPDGETLRLRASTGLAKRAVGRATLRIGEGMTGYALEANRPVFSTKAADHPHFKRILGTQESHFNSLLAIPLLIEGKPIGALNVQNINRYVFSDDEIDVVALIGDLAAGALAKAQLYDRQRQQIEELQALAQVSEIVTSPQYLDDMLDVVTEMAAQTMNTAVCSIFLLDESGRTLKLHSARRNWRDLHQLSVLTVRDSLLGEVATLGRPLYVADMNTKPNKLEYTWAHDEGLVSLLAIPLSVRDRIIGVLSCYTREQHIFTEQQTALFSTLANQTALAIENAQLITNTAVVREMHHRIKNNLQTVAMLMQLQMAEADRLDTRQVLEMNIHRIRSIAAVHEVLSEKGFKLVDVTNVLERITLMTAETLVKPDQHIQIRVHGEALLLPSKAATALTLVVNELVQNALEHAFVGRDKGIVEVSIGFSPDEIIVLVRDNGIGLPADHQTNLGLELVEMLIKDDLNGRYRFNHLSPGTEVSIRLPRAIEKGLD